MNTLKIFLSIIFISSPLMAQQKLDPSNAELVTSFKNFASNHEFAKNAALCTQLTATFAKVWYKERNFSKDRSAIEKETGGGEGNIYKLVEVYPELKPTENTMLEINYGHTPDPKVVAWLKERKDQGYTITMLDNIAPDTLKTWQTRYPEVFQLFDRVVTVPQDLKKLKTPQPYLYNALKDAMYGSAGDISSNEHREIPQEIVDAGKQLIWIANQGKISGALQAKLPVVASYCYSNADSGLFGAFKDKITPTGTRLSWLNESLKAQGVQL